MNFLAWMLIFLFSFCVIAQEQNSAEINNAGNNQILKKAFELYSQGNYQSTVEELNQVEQLLESKADSNKALKGLVYYWQGICYNRLQDFPNSIESFDKALQNDYSPIDLNYEYGQALFAAEKLTDARLQFRESLNKKFKRAVSLYYIAYISKEMGQRKQAVTFYKAIDKMDPAEAQDVKQAAEMQIGDIYLDQVEKHPDAFKAVEQYVIPQYEKALKVDENSGLAPQIKEKIIQLQQKYDLVLFKLRNGRPTLIPPYFIRASEEVGHDTNVAFAATETTVSKSKQGSFYSKTDFIGRYTFYHKNFFSLAPEFRTNYTRYFNRVKEIYKNDNYLIAPAIRTAYEHSLWKKPASTLVDYDFSYAHRDVHQRQSLDFSSRAHTFMLGERFNFFDFGETIVRLRHRIFESYSPTNNSHTNSLVFEQIKRLKVNTLLFYASYDRTRVVNDLYDTNGFTFRTDLIMTRIGDWFTPSFGLSFTRTDPINARSTRGTELLVNPSARLSKTIGKNWRGNFKFDYSKNNSKDTENFAYKKTTYALELEYLF
ncbi:MAG: tetratricopeptide repeat protein [Bacteriovoracaceae bacterium]